MAKKEGLLGESMKPRKLYYRRKAHSIIIEGKQDGKSVLIWTLPDPLKLISEILLKSSFLTHEKIANIAIKIERLDFMRPKLSKGSQEVLPININRNPERDAINTSMEQSKEDQGALDRKAEARDSRTITTLDIHPGLDSEPSEEEIEKSLKEAKS